MEVKERTSRQVSQDQNKDRSGKFQTSQPCEACGKPAGHGYWSANGNSGEGLTLCGRQRCPATILSKQHPYPEYADLIKQHCIERASAR